jgi:DNA-binding response OmpR family regulator
MLTDKPILIVEDNVYLALDLAAAVENLNGRVLGPVGTVVDALAILSSGKVAGAILDFELPDSDASLVAQALVEQDVPFVIHSDNPVPPEILALRPKTPVVMKPIRPQDVVAILADEVIKAPPAL